MPAPNKAKKAGMKNPLKIRPTTAQMETVVGRLMSSSKTGGGFHRPAPRLPLRVVFPHTTRLFKNPPTGTPAAATKLIRRYITNSIGHKLCDVGETIISAIAAATNGKIVPRPSTRAWRTPVSPRITPLRNSNRNVSQDIASTPVTKTGNRGTGVSGLRNNHTGRQKDNSPSSIAPTKAKRKSRLIFRTSHAPVEHPASKTPNSAMPKF